MIEISREFIDSKGYNRIISLKNELYTIILENKNTLLKEVKTQKKSLSEQFYLNNYILNINIVNEK